MYTIQQQIVCFLFILKARLCIICFIRSNKKISCIFITGFLTKLSISVKILILKHLILSAVFCEFKDFEAFYCD
jgi:hypothetical protein